MRCISWWFDDACCEYPVNEEKKYWNQIGPTHAARHVDTLNGNHSRPIDKYVLADDFISFYFLLLLPLGLFLLDHSKGAS